MIIPKPSHIILFGGSPLIIAAAKMLREKNFSLDIFTSPRQEAEIIRNNNGDGETLGRSLCQAGMDWYSVTDDINRDLPAQSIDDRTLGIGFGEAWPFKKPLLDAFGNRLVDFMGIPLPQYRGGAHYSWAIMNEKLEWGCCIQVHTLNTVQGEVDDGAILFEQTYKMPYTTFTPQDWFDACNEFEVKFLANFVDNIMLGRPFDLKTVNESDSLFFPRLNTANQGWINWSWPGEEIVNFINAFDSPYQGASTTINGQTVQLCGAEFRAGIFHPFTAGLILRMGPDGVTIATAGGSLHVQQVIGSVTMRPGQRFFTSTERLENAMTYTPNYTASGDVQPGSAVNLILAGKKVSLRPLLASDCTDTYLGWLNDPEVNKYLETRFDKQTRLGLQKYAQAMDESDNDYAFAIVENEGLRHIGNIKIGNINWNHKFADVGYFIGERKLWGRGLATEAIKLASAFAFKTIGIYHLRAGVYERNVGSQKALRKAGYRYEGMWNGQLLDDAGRTAHVWYSLTADSEIPA